MAYNELIKNFNKIRSYMRQFFAYGFRSRDEFDVKSARSYDNEKRRVESWLGEHMSFHQGANGKAVFFSVDSRRIQSNPLHKAWKASGFTRNDISLHFILLDILIDGIPRSMPELLDTIDQDFVSKFPEAEPIDESTLRKKLKEYVELGLLTVETQGKQYLYSLSDGPVNLNSWRDAIVFFSEDNPLGVVGSFLQDKFDDSAASIFSFKHRYLLFAIDSGILLELLFAIRGQQKIEIDLAGDSSGGTRRALIIPLKIFQSVQGGRQYLAAYTMWKKRIAFFRVDSITKVKPLEVVENYETYQNRLQEEQAKIWGVASGYGHTQRLEMKLTVVPRDMHIVHRLEREKRCGTVIPLGGNEWLFSADVYDAWELMPWLRTFIGRISSLTCSHKMMEEQFWTDYRALTELYGGDSNAV